MLLFCLDPVLNLPPPDLWFFFPVGVTICGGCLRFGSVDTERYEATAAGAMRRFEEGKKREKKRRANPACSPPQYIRRNPAAH